MLSTDAESPVVTKTTVSTDLLETLKIVTELGVNVVGEDLVILAVNDITLSVEEPSGNLVLCWVLDDGDNSLELFGGKFTSTIIDISPVRGFKVSFLFSDRTAC